MKNSSEKSMYILLVWDWYTKNLHRAEILGDVTERYNLCCCKSSIHTKNYSETTFDTYLFILLWSLTEIKRMFLVESIQRVRSGNTCSKPLPLRSVSSFLLICRVPKPYYVFKVQQRLIKTYWVRFRTASSLSADR